MTQTLTPPKVIPANPPGWRRGPRGGVNTSLGQAMTTERTTRCKGCGKAIYSDHCHRRCGECSERAAAIPTRPVVRVPRDVLREIETWTQEG